MFKFSVVFLLLFSIALRAQNLNNSINLFDATQSNEVLDIYLYVKIYKNHQEFQEVDSLYQLLDNSIEKEPLRIMNTIAYAEAIDKLGYNSKALDLLSVINSKLETYPIVVQSEYFSMMGGLALRSMNPEFATKQYQKSLDLIEDSSQVSKEIIQDKIIRVGVGLNASLRYQEAMKAFEKAMEYELLGTNRNSLYLKLNIALTNSYLGKLEDAKKYFLEALQIIQKNKDVFAELRTYGNLGDIYMKQDSLHSAKKFYQQGLYKVEACGFKLDAFRFQYSLSDLYYKSKQLDSAYIHLKLADSIRNYYNVNIVSKKIVEMDLLHKIQREELEKEMNAELLKLEAEKKRVLLFFCVLLLVGCLILSRQLILLREKNKFLLKEQLKSIQLEKRASNPKTRIANSANYSTIINALEEAVDKNKIYKDKGLTLEKLAKKVNTNRTYLSEAINSCYQKSFSQWINELRILESKRMLASLDFDHYSIAKDIGFASISTFNLKTSEKSKVKI
ncbi:MAG: tetratricopeptide repeat protein [Aureispira sp.]|nr:tetratricopeptide repeat protein [Aureispira sp.]